MTPDVGTNGNFNFIRSRQSKFVSEKRDILFPSEIYCLVNRPILLLEYGGGERLFFKEYLPGHSKEMKIKPFLRKARLRRARR
jgi:hypothetical protein